MRYKLSVQRSLKFYQCQTNFSCEISCGKVTSEILGIIQTIQYVSKKDLRKSTIWKHLYKVKIAHRSCCFSPKTSLMLSFPLFLILRKRTSRRLRKDEHCISPLTSLTRCQAIQEVLASFTCLPLKLAVHHFSSLRRSPSSFAMEKTTWRSYSGGKQLSKLGCDELPAIVSEMITNTKIRVVMNHVTRFSKKKKIIKTTTASHLCRTFLNKSKRILEHSSTNRCSSVLLLHRGREAMLCGCF